MTHVCVSKLTTIGSDNGLSPGRHQAIIWTNAGILSIGPLAINFSEILIEIQIFSFKQMYLKLSSAKWRPLRLGLNVLSHIELTICSQTITDMASCRGIQPFVDICVQLFFRMAAILVYIECVAMQRKKHYRLCQALFIQHSNWNNE